MTCPARMRITGDLCQLPAGHTGWHQRGAFVWGPEASEPEDETPEPEGDDDADGG